MGLLFAGAAVAGAAFYAFVNYPDFRNRIVRIVASGYGVEIDTGSIQFDLSTGFQVSASSFFIRAKDGQWSLKSNEAQVKLKPFSLLHPRLLPEQIRFESPVLEVQRIMTPEPASPFRSSGISHRIHGYLLKEIDAIEVRNGAFHPGDIPWGVESLDVHIKRETASGQASFNLSTTVTENHTRRTQINAVGTIGITGKSIDQTPVDMLVTTPSFDLSRIPWPSVIPSVKGKSAVSVQLSGQIRGPLRYAGDLQMEGVELMLAKGGRSKIYMIPSAAANVSGMLSKKSLTIDAFWLKGANATFSGVMDLDFSEPAEPTLYLMIQSEPMTLDAFKALYPDPLTNPWLNQELFPIFSSGQARLNHLTLNGAIYRISHMGAPENRDTFAISLGVSDLSAFGGEWGPPVTSISGDITISQGALTITQVSGKTGKSSLFDGSLTLPNLYEAPGTGDIAIKGTVDLTDLLPLKPARYLTKVLKRLLEPVQSLNGSAAAEVLLGVSERWKKIKWRQGNIDFTRATMRHQKIPGTVFVEKGRMIVKEGTASQLSGEGTYEASAMIFSVKIEENWDAHQLLMDLKLDNNRELGQLLPKISDVVNIVKPVTCNLSIDSKNNEVISMAIFCPSAGLQIQREGFRITPATDGAGIRFSLNRNGTGEWRIEKITYTGPSGEMEFRVPNGELQNLKNIQIHSQGIRLEDIGIFIGDATQPMKGIVLGDVNVEFRNSGFPEFKGGVMVKDLTLPPLTAPPLARGFDGELTLSGHTMEIRNGRLSFPGGVFTMQGRLSKGQALTGEIEAKSPGIDLVDMMEAFQQKETDPASSTAPSKKDGNPLLLDLSLKVFADNLKWHEFTITDASTELKIKNSGTRIEYGKGTFPEGKINLSGQVSPGKRLSLSTHINLSPQLLEDLMKKLGVSASKIKGTLSAEGFFYTAGSKMEECIQNLIGTINFELKKGYFENASVVLKILDFLSLQNIFIKHPPKTAADAFYFHEIQGNVEVLGSKLKTEHIRMKSPVFNAVAAGEVDWVKDSIDAKIGAQPLNTIDYLVSKIPVIGHILTGKEQSLLVYYFEVKGSMRNPEVVHVPFESLSKNFTGYIERLLLSPVQLFKQLSQMVRFLTSQGAEIPAEE